MVNKAIALFGGSFDPVHAGHTAVAEAVCMELQLTQLHLMPCFLQPLKSSAAASTAQRLTMLEYAIADIPMLTVDTRELTSSTGGVSFTIDTLKDLRQDVGEHASIIFVIGWDSLQSLPKWKSWRHLFDVTNFAVVTRPGYSGIQHAELASEIQQRTVDVSILRNVCCGKIAFLKTQEWDISSSTVRENIGFGRDMSEWLNPRVMNFIRKENIYRAMT